MVWAMMLAVGTLRPWSKLHAMHGCLCTFLFVFVLSCVGRERPCVGPTHSPPLTSLTKWQKKVSKAGKKLVKDQGLWCILASLWQQYLGSHRTYAQYELLYYDLRV